MTTFVRILLWAGGSLLALLLATLGVETLLQGNLMGWCLVLTGLFYFIGGVVYLRRDRSQGAIALQETGDLSFWLMLPGFLAIFYGPPLETLYLPEVLPRLVDIQIAGLVLTALGLALLSWARLALRELYSGHLHVVDRHRLVRVGPYRYLRHPAYTGFVLIALGLSVGFSSLIGLAAIPLLLLPGLAYRMHVEEKLLVERFGDEYRDYSRTTHRLIPGVW